MLRIATRQSPLALWQAEHVSGLLAALGIQTELVPLVSGGDTDMRPIDGTRQVGLFTKRIQQAVLDDEADVAVHSLKDLPTEFNEHLVLAAVPERETVADCLVSPAAWTLDQLPVAARVGTGSRRRAAQLLSRRPDLQIQAIRGNVQTRLSKLQRTADNPQPLDAILLADAGLVRLEMDAVPRYRLTLDEMLPAPGQGALGIEVRAGDSFAREAIARLDHLETRAAVTAERTLLASLHGGCLAPIAAYAVVARDRLSMTAVALSPDGTERIDERDDVLFSTAAAVNLAQIISEKMIARGALSLLRSN